MAWTEVDDGSTTSTSTTINVADANFTISDNSDATKQLQFQVSGITTATTRTLTVPDVSDTLVTLTSAQTLTNKTVNLASNTLTGTTAEFNTALSDGNFATIAGSETLTNKTLTAPSMTTANVTDGNLQVSSQRFVSFTLFIQNDAGTLKHQIVTDASSLAATNFAAAITGASATATATPSLDSVTDFTTGVGIEAAATHIVHMNTAEQTAGNLAVSAVITRNSSTTAVLVNVIRRSINVNGTTRGRIALVFTNATSGANFGITTANVGSGTSIAVRIHGFIA